MDKNVKSLWIEALRSGDYVQGSFNLKRLHDDKQIRHCCLGVLCELACKEGVVKEEVEYQLFLFDELDDYLPESVLCWSGLSNSEEAELANLNDWTESSFKDIADYIEQNF